MYILSLELIKNCNLNCRYCYLGEKDNSAMTLSVAVKAIDLAIHEAVKQYDKTIVTYFIGGEPLLAYEMMKQCVSYIEEQCRKNNLHSVFSTTMNGTLLNEEFIDFFIDKRFEFKISIDGTEYIHDMNRKDFNDKGSYNDIVANIPLIQKYEKETGLFVHAAQVIDINNCGNILESLSHVKKLGFSVVESSVNNFDKWTEESVNTLYEQLDKAFEFYLNLKLCKDKFVWVFIEARLENFFSTVNFYNCKAGLSSIFITVSGDIYPCTEIDDNVRIGTVYSGLDVTKIRSFIAINHSKNQECVNCEEYSHCETCGCIMSNYEINHDIYKPVDIDCLVTKHMYSLFRTKLGKEQLTALNNYFKEKERAR